MRTSLLVILLVAFASGTAAARRLSVPDAVTPVVASFIGGDTAPVKGSDGLWHVVYELWLSNARAVPAVLERIDVLDYDDRHRIIASLAGEKLTAAMHELSSRTATDTSLAANASKLVLIDLAFERRVDVPKAIVHRFSGSGGVSAAGSAAEAMSYLAAPWDLTLRKVPVLGPPLAGGGWVVLNGCCADRGAHRGAVLPVAGRLYDSQRFAIDWMRVDAEGRLVHGDASKVENYLAYDQPVLAVAAGTVVEVLDALDDQTPGSLPDPATINIANIDGNHVIVDIGKGFYAFFAHLRHGTVRVKVGDRVRIGQELGRVGNTGNTSAPHLHLHIVDAPSALAADGVPYVFERFKLTGRIDSEQWNAPDSELETAYRIVEDEPGPRRDELPLDLSVVEFPARR